MTKSAILVLLLALSCQADRYRAELSLQVSGEQLTPTRTSIDGTFDIEVYVHSSGAEIYTQLELTGNGFSFRGSSAQDNYKLNNPDWGFNIWLVDDTTGDFYASQSQEFTLDYLTDLDAKTIRVFPALASLGDPDGPPVAAETGMELRSDPFDGLMLPTFWSVNTLPFDEVLGLVEVPDGDANGDGKVDFTDFLALQEHFNTAGFYRDGDFNYDDTVDFVDFLILSGNFGAESEAATNVPEPSSTALLAVFAGCVAIVRQTYRGRVFRQRS